MKKEMKNGLIFVKVALRHRKQADDAIHHQIFWDALSGFDGLECEEYTQVLAAKEYFESDEYKKREVINA
jgi:hypothetical protein